MADSEVDMRYQLDLSHVEDLPINSLGRRVRTRLYFTSESHLHTLLNVLRSVQHEAKHKHKALIRSDACVCASACVLIYLRFSFSFFVCVNWGWPRESRW